MSRTLIAFDLRLGWAPCGWLAFGAFGRYSVGPHLQSSSSDAAMSTLVGGGFASVHPIPSAGFHIDALLGFARVTQTREGSESVSGPAFGATLGWLAHVAGACPGIALQAMWSPWVTGGVPSYSSREQWSGSAYQLGAQLSLQR